MMEFLTVEEKYTRESVMKTIDEWCVLRRKTLAEVSRLLNIPYITLQRWRMRTQHMGRLSSNYIANHQTYRIMERELEHANKQ